MQNRQNINLYIFNYDLKCPALPVEFKKSNYEKKIDKKNSKFVSYILPRGTRGKRANTGGGSMGRRPPFGKKGGLEYLLTPFLETNLKFYCRI